MKYDSNGKFEKLKNNVGGKAFNLFEENLKNRNFDEKQKELSLKAASTLVAERPYVLMPFRDRGFLQSKKDMEILGVFRPNLWLQDYAFEINRLHEVDISTAPARAKAVFEYVYYNNNFAKRIMNRRNKTELDFVDALNEATLIESAYYSRIGGEEMPEDVAKKIDIALMKRSLNNETMLGTIAKKQGIDKDDPISLIQLSEDLDLTGCLQDISTLDPYFNRRKTQIMKFNEINSEKSVKLPTLNHDGFALELIRRLLKKGRVDSWLIKEVEKYFGKPIEFDYDKYPVS